MTETPIPFNHEMEQRGRRAVGRLIAEVRQQEGEEMLAHFVAGALLTLFGYYAHDVGTLKPIEALLERRKNQSVEGDGQRHVEPKGRLQ